MDIINKYFANIVFFKVEPKEGFAIYAAAVRSAFGDGKKNYVLALVPEQVAIISKGYLYELQWQNLQTRLLTHGYNIPIQHWEIPRNLPLPMFALLERRETFSKYVSEEPSHSLEMILLHDQKKRSTYQYHNRVNIVAALSTFRCVITSLDFVTSPPTQSPSSFQPPQMQEFDDPDPPGYTFPYQAPELTRAVVPTSVAYLRPGVDYSHLSEAPVRAPPVRSKAPQGMPPAQHALQKALPKTFPHQGHPHPHPQGHPQGQMHIDDSFELIEPS